MEHTIGFPNLGLEFTLSRVACTVLGKDIYWYGIIICAGFILAALYVNSRTKDFGITSDNLTDCLIICVPLGIICARIYYVVFEWGYYAQHPGEIIAIWKGGIAIYGGIIGTLIGLFVYSRVKKLSLASLCDLAAFGLLNAFQGFLSLMSALIPPLAGVLIAAYWIVGKGKKENFEVHPGFSAVGVISFAVGAIFACITGGTFASFPGLVEALPFLNWPFFVGPVNGIVVSLVLYVILAKAFPAKNK